MGALVFPLSDRGIIRGDGACQGHMGCPDRVSSRAVAFRHGHEHESGRRDGAVFGHRLGHFLSPYAPDSCPRMVLGALSGLVGLLLVFLKLLDAEPFEDWSWWLVTAPWWLGVAVHAVLVLLALIFGKASRER